MTDRRTEILAAIDAMINEHNRWVDDPESPPQPTERMEVSIDAAVMTCAHGDIPADCRQLVGAMALLGHEWNAYRNGTRDRRHCPVPSFWDAFRGVILAREAAVIRPPRRPEPVAELIRQKVGYEQIARHIYGDGESGPFLDRGSVRVDLILQEAEKPGSVIPADWIHPAERKRAAEELASLNGRLASLRAMPTDQASEDSATIEELLREGAFPEQVARVKRTTIEHVREVAAAAGIRPNEMPNLGAMRAPHEPELTPEQDAGLQLGWRTGRGDDAAIDGDDGMDGVAFDTNDATDLTEPLGDADVNRMIVAAAGRNPGVGSPELAAIVSADIGQPVSAQKVAAVLRTRKGQPAGPGR